MSTRSHIIIKGLRPMLYRHCDGYPTTEHGVLATLLPFLTEFMAVRGDDPSYMLARMAQRLMNKHVPDEFLSYGIDMAMHGDEEYVYVVDTKKRVVEVRGTMAGFGDIPHLRHTELLSKETF